MAWSYDDSFRRNQAHLDEKNREMINAEWTLMKSIITPGFKNSSINHTRIEKEHREMYENREEVKKLRKYIRPFTQADIGKILVKVAGNDIEDYSYTTDKIKLLSFDEWMPDALGGRHKEIKAKTFSPRDSTDLGYEYCYGWVVLEELTAEEQKLFDHYFWRK